MNLRLAGLALGTFAIGTDAYVISAILDKIGTDLVVSTAAAGQLVTVFALTYALLAPVLAAATATWPRRRVLLAALTVLTAGNLVTVLSAGYATAMAGRIVAAAGASLYTPVAAGVAAGLVPPERRARALAVVVAGLTTATVLGVPLGAWLSGLSGWRATIWFVIGLTGLAAAGIATVVPPVPAPPPITLRQRLAPLADRQVLAVLAVTVAMLATAYGVFTYLETATRPATHGDKGRLAVLTLAFGLGGLAGSVLAGRLTDRYGPRRVVITGLAVAPALAASIPLAAAAMPVGFALILLWGFFGWLTVIPQQVRLVALAPAAAPLVLGLNQSAIYLGIAFSGGAGAAGLALDGRTGLAAVAAVLGVTSLTLLALSFRAERRVRIPEPVTT